MLFHEGLTVFGLKTTVVEDGTVSLNSLIGGKVEPGESFKNAQYASVSKRPVSLR